MNAIILKSKLYHVSVGDVGEVEFETDKGAAIRFKKVFEFTHKPTKQETTRTYWFRKGEYKINRS